MNQETYSLWVRINGIAHSFGRELGCPCNRCRAVNYHLPPPPSRLETFPGWEDPPHRAHTSASLLIGNQSGGVSGHLLIDVGGGVVDGLAGTAIPGLAEVSAVLLTHGHRDHSCGLSQLGESLRHAAQSHHREFTAIPLYCTLATYRRLYDHGGLNQVLDRCFSFREIAPESPFTVEVGPKPVRVTPLPVVHGSIDGAVIYLAEALEKKILFAWDMETPDAAFPDGRTNLDVFRDYASLLNHADLHLQECNTWAVPGWGHSTYQQAKRYFEIVAARRTLLVHYSGHEEGPGAAGYGWTDAQWQAAVEPDGVGAAWQGMLFPIT